MTDQPPPELRLGVVGVGQRAGLATRRPAREGPSGLVRRPGRARTRRRPHAVRPRRTAPRALRGHARGRPRRRLRRDPRRPAHRARAVLPRSGRRRVRREATGHHPRRLRPGAGHRRPHPHPSLRRPQPAASAGPAHHAPSRDRGRHRDRTGCVVPPLRRPRRRLLLQGLARRTSPHHGPVAPEGRPRPGRDPLAGRRQRPYRHRAGRPGGLRCRHAPALRTPGLAAGAGLVRRGCLAAVPTARPQPGRRRRGHQHGADPPRQRRPHQLPAVPLHPRLLAQLHRHRRRGPHREPRRRHRGDPPVVKVWNRRRSGYRPEADRTLGAESTESAEGTDAAHGGADQALVDEFLRFVAHGAATDTSPVAAREAVATGIAATVSLRSGGTPSRCPPSPRTWPTTSPATSPAHAARPPGPPDPSHPPPKPEDAEARPRAHRGAPACRS